MSFLPVTSSPSAYIIGSDNVCTVLDLDGVYAVLEGTPETSLGIINHVRDVAVAVVSAPTLNNLGTSVALSQLDPPVPVLGNLPQIKTAKPESSAAQLKQIQAATSGRRSLKPAQLSPKYEPIVVYSQLKKGTLQLYVLAGDAKDGEALGKALASGNEETVNKAAATNGSVIVLLWWPSDKSKNVKRILLTGTASIERVHQALEKASKHLPFLNKATVTAGEAFSVPVPPSNPPAPKSTSAKPVSARGAPSAAPARNAPKSAVPPSRPVATSKTAPTARPATSAPTRAAPARNTAVPARGAPARAPPARGTPVKSAPAKPITTAPPAKKIGSSSNTAASTRNVGAPTASSKAPARVTAAPSSAPVKKPAQEQPKAVPIVEVTADESVIFVEEIRRSVEPVPQLDIVVIPPTPEPPRDTPEPPKSPVDQQAPAVPEPSIVAPQPRDVVEEAVVVAAQDVPLVAEPTPTPNERLLDFTDDTTAAAAHQELPDGEQLRKLSQQMINDSADSLSNALASALIIGSPLVNGDTVQGLVQNEAPAPPVAEPAEPVVEPVRHVQELDYSAGVPAQENPVPAQEDFIPAASIDHVIDSLSNGHEINGGNDVVDQLLNHGFHEGIKAASEVDRSDVLGQMSVKASADTQRESENNEALVRALSEQSDRFESEGEWILQDDSFDPKKVLHFPAKPFTSSAPHFTRPFFFDLVTAPHDGTKTTLTEDSAREFFAQVRASTYILHTKDISERVLDKCFGGKSASNMKAPVKVVPTHASPMLSSFLANNESEFATFNISFNAPIDHAKLTVHSDEGTTQDYPVVKVSL